MSEKHLTDGPWKTLAKQKTITKDADLGKALAEFGDLPETDYAARLAAIDDIKARAKKLQKEHEDDQEVADYLDEVMAQAEKTRKAIEALKKGAPSDDDKDDADDEEAAEYKKDLKTKLMSALNQVKARAPGAAEAGEEAKPQLRFMSYVAGKACAVVVARKVGGATKKLLLEIAGVASGGKFHKGDCIFEKSVHTFVLEEVPAGLARTLARALLAETGVKYKVRVRNTDGSVDLDSDADDDADETTATPPAASPPEAGAAARDAAFKKLAARLKPLIPQIYAMPQVKAFPGTPAEKSLIAVVKEAGDLAKKSEFVKANDLVDTVEDLLKKAATAASTGAAPPSASPSSVGPAARDQVRDAMTAGDLASKLADTAWRKDVMDWLETVGDPDVDMKKELVAVLRAAPEGDAKLREKAFAKAFRCTLISTTTGAAGETPDDVPPPILLKVVDIIETFPADHLPAKWKLNGVDGTDSSGTWIPEEAMAQMDYGVADAPAFDQVYRNAEAGDPLEGAKCFDVMIRHEVGHAVHSTKNGKALTDTTDGGGWKIHQSFDSLLTELSPLVDSFAAEIKTGLQMDVAPTRAVREILATAGVENFRAGGKKLLTTLQTALYQKFSDDNLVPSWNPKPSGGVPSASNPGGPPPPPGAPPPPGPPPAPGAPGAPGASTVMTMAQKKTALLEAIPMGHDLIKVITQGCISNAFFSLGPRPFDYKGRVYLDSGLGDEGWVSFEASTRAKMVSMYQYRAPGEWFAEFYATVNNGDPGVRAKGRDAYKNAYQWFADKGLLIHP